MKSLWEKQKTTRKIQKQFFEKTSRNLIITEKDAKKQKVEKEWKKLKKVLDKLNKLWYSYEAVSESDRKEPW